MNVLDELWKRLLISLAFGAIAAKVLATLTFKKVEISGLFIAIILYIFLTRIYNRSEKGNQNQK